MTPNYFGNSVYAGLTRTTASVILIHRPKKTKEPNRWYADETTKRVVLWSEGGLEAHEFNDVGEPVFDQTGWKIANSTISDAEILNKLIASRDLINKMIDKLQ